AVFGECPVPCGGIVILFTPRYGTFSASDSDSPTCTVTVIGSSESESISSLPVSSRPKSSVTLGASASVIFAAGKCTTTSPSPLVRLFSPSKLPRPAYDAITLITRNGICARNGEIPSYPGQLYNPASAFHWYIS